MPETLDAGLVRTLAKQFHTPLYVFCENTIRRQCRALKESITCKNRTIRYACKALTLQAVLRIIKDEGLSIDASSLNEALRALRAGFSPSQILYTGESASVPVFSELLKLGVSLNCSSLDQLRLIGELSPGHSVSVRFNPGEGHGANNKVNTGGPASKHGVYLDQINDVKTILKEYRLKLTGIHSHIGSGTDLGHWLRIMNLTLEIARQFDGLEFIDLGGGLPVVYNPETDSPMPLNEWGKRLGERFEQFCLEYGANLRLEIEPGRYVVAESGFLIAEVQNLKRTPSFNYALVNTGFNHNSRPAMYGSHHPIEFVPADGRQMSGLREYLVGGYLCESGDVFTVGEGGVLIPRKFPELKLGDLMLMGNVGAYSHAMKSEYNSMNLPASVLVRSDGSFQVMERRGTLEDIMRRELEVF